MIRSLAMLLALLVLAVSTPVHAEEIQTLIAYQDADEFRTFGDADAARLAEVVRRIGKVEVQP